MMPNQILATLEDTNAFLPNLITIDDGDDKQLQVDAQRVIKSQLAGVFTPLILTGWDEPANTPELIRGIAGRLIAAKFYAKQFSQESTVIPLYAQSLYNEAISMLADIKAGRLIVLDENNEPIGSGSALDLGENDLFPNNSSAEPVFTMGQEFA